MVMLTEAANARKPIIRNGVDYSVAAAPTAQAETSHLGTIKPVQATAGQAETADVEPAVAIDYSPDAKAEQAVVAQGTARGAGVDTSEQAQISAPRTAQGFLATASGAKTQQAVAAPAGPAQQAVVGQTGPAQRARTSQADATGYAAKTGEIKPESTVEARLNKMLGKDSAYLRRASHQGYLKAAARGLGNSSFAAGASVGEAMDRALPIAAQDAQASFQNMRANTDSINRAGEFTANAENEISSLNAQLETAVSQGNAQEANRLQGLQAQLVTSISQSNAEQANQLEALNAQLETAVSQGNAQEANRLEGLVAQLETSVSQGNAQLETAVSQFNSKEFNDIAKQNAQLMQQNSQFNAKITTETRQFNAQAKNQMEALNTQLATAVSQSNTQETNRILSQVMALRTQVASQNADAKNRLNMFQAEQQNNINSLNAQLETAVSQGNAQEANRLQQAIAQMRTQIEVANTEMLNQMGIAQMQLDGSILKQMLTGTQAAEIATIQGDFALLTQQSENAAGLYESFFQSVGTAATNPEFGPAGVTAVVNTLLPHLKGGMKFIQGMATGGSTGGDTGGDTGGGTGGNIGDTGANLQQNLRGWQAAGGLSGTGKTFVEWMEDR